MNFVKFIMGLGSFILGLIILFLFAWYIALPLLIVILFFSILGILRTKWILYKANKQYFNHHRKQKEKNSIIDVDFTEIK